MELLVRCVLVAAALALCYVPVWSVSAHETDAYARTEAGWVRGAADLAGDYAYFLNVPYAKQPVGALRFQELQHPEPWSHYRDATEPGPICPQRDLVFGPLINPRSQSEECIHANIYVPLEYLPTRARGEERPKLPVLVYVHGGGFAFGSGDPDLHGPQYLVKDNVVVITFNYRVGVFGFLSLNSTSVPGNAALRDMVTLLRWVQRNVEAFGGDKNDVTIAGQSAGAAATHLLSLSQATQGLFHRVILMSGAASRGFFTTSPAYAQTMSELLFNFLGINTTDSEERHRQLIALPLDRIMEAHNQIQEFTGLVTFTPVVESEHPGVMRILDDEPEALLAQGRGKDIPLLIGFTNVECETFRPRYEEIDIVQRIKNSSQLVLPIGVIHTTPAEQLPDKIASIENKYFSESLDTLDMEQYLKWCSDNFFIYPALKLAETRAANEGAPVFLYRFAYNADNSVYKNAIKREYLGAGHAEDLAFVFRHNFALGNASLSTQDSAMVTKMTSYFTNFMRYGKPVKSSADWRPVSPVQLKKSSQYNNIINFEEPDQWASYRAMTKFFDGLYDPTTLTKDPEFKTFSSNYEANDEVL